MTSSSLKATEHRHTQKLKPPEQIGSDVTMELRSYIFKASVNYTVFLKNEVYSRGSALTLKVGGGGHAKITLASKFRVYILDGKNITF